MASPVDSITAAVWGALLGFRWFGKHVEEEALVAAEAAIREAVAVQLTPTMSIGSVPAPRVVVVQMAGDWEALYVEGLLQFEGHHVRLSDIEAHLPDFKVERIEVTEGQWGVWGFRAPKTLEEL